MRFFAGLFRTTRATPPERLRGDVGLDAPDKRKGWWDYW